MQPTVQQAAMVVSYTPVALASRAARLGTATVSRAISAVIGLVVAVVMWQMFKPLPVWSLVLLAVGVAAGIGTFIITLLGQLRVRRIVSQVPRGPVLSIERAGLVLDHAGYAEYLEWFRIAAIRGRTRRRAPGPVLEVVRVDGTVWSVAFVLLEVLPGSIDSGIRAYSNGRFSLDMTRCDDIW